MVEMIVLPSSASFFNNNITCRAVVESNPVVGSSKNITPGFVISSTPIEVLLRSPPLMPLMNVLPTFTSAQLLNPN